MRSGKIAALIIGSAFAQKGSRASTDPIYTCPPEYMLQDKQCVKQVIVQAERQCPADTINTGVECIRRFDRKVRCPMGSVEQGKQCVVNESEPAIPVCPIGYKDTGYQCETSYGLDIVEYCEKGTREGPSCVTVDVAPHQHTQACPPGYELAAKGGCWKLTTYDCTPAGGKGSLRSMAGNSRPAHAKLHITQQTCERKESAPMIHDKFCPPGMEDTGDACIVKHTHALLRKCANGASEDQCFTTKTAPYKFDCLNGGRLEDQMCWITRTAQPESYCPQGIDDGASCTLSEPPMTICPPGLTLTGGVCMGIETTQPEVTVTVTCTGKNCYH